MKNATWSRPESQNDTTVIATGCTSKEEAKKVAEEFCASISGVQCPSDMQIIIDGEAKEYDDEPGNYYFDTDCVNL